MKKEHYLYVREQKVKVGEQIYKIYWQEKRTREVFRADGQKKSPAFLFVIGSRWTLRR